LRENPHDIAQRSTYIVNNRSSTGMTSLTSISNPQNDAIGGFRVDRLRKTTFRQHIAERLRAAILGGEIAPGAQLVETALAAQFDVSRGPLREALRELIEEGLLVTVPYTGTHVIALTVDDIHEIYSMRITLERFAFEQAWPKRDDAFARELQRRNMLLTQAIDAGDDAASILAELDLHGLVYEASGHKLLQRTWHSLRGRLQLYWAAHHRAHATRGPKRDSHDGYVQAALGDNLDLMLAEITNHMGRGAQRTESFMRFTNPFDPSPTTGATP
jgi:DNA-binding GntR family transcriptional regulator